MPIPIHIHIPIPIHIQISSEVEAIKKLPSQMLYPYFAKKSPFMVEQFQDWWMGGVDDMAVWSTWCWPQVINWLDNGMAANATNVFPFVCPSHVMYNRIAEKSSTSKGGDKPAHSLVAKSQVYNDVKNDRALWRRLLKEELRPFAERVRVNIEKTEYGAIFSSSPSPSPIITPPLDGIVQQSKKRINVIDNNIINNIINNNNQNDEEDGGNVLASPNNAATYCNARRDPDMMIVSQQPYALLGSSAATANFDGDDYSDIVLGAPGKFDMSIHLYIFIHIDHTRTTATVMVSILISYN